jgi:hypothetical protein
MIFRIGMPIIEDLMSWLDSDDVDRGKVSRPRWEIEIKDPFCHCICWEFYATNNSTFIMMADGSDPTGP